MNDFQAVGYVVGEVRTDGFTFVTNPELAPPRLEYIVLRGVREQMGDAVRSVDVLAQVTGLSVSSRLLSQSMNYSEVEAILRRLGASPPVVVGQAKVLGFLDAETRSVRVPRGAAMPGAVVEKASDALLTQFFSRGVTDGLDIGSLINRPNVDVLLDPNGLRRHLAVIAQTGAGKSYTVGVVLEQLLALGGTIVVFDPNSDYVLMGQTPRRTPTDFAERVQVYRVPSDQASRIPDADIGAVRRLTVQFSTLDPDEVCDVAGISEKATNIRLAVRTAAAGLAGDYTPKDLLAALEALGEMDRGEGDGGAWPGGDWAGLAGGPDDGGDAPDGPDAAGTPGAAGPTPGSAPGAAVRPRGTRPGARRVPRMPTAREAARAPGARPVRTPSAAPRRRTSTSTTSAG